MATLAHHLPTLPHPTHVSRPSSPSPGEHMHEFEPFETTKFVSRLLGRGDWGGFIDKVKDVIPEVRQLCFMGLCLRGYTLLCASRRH